MSNFIVSWRTARHPRRCSLRVRALNASHAEHLILEKEPRAQAVVVVEE